MNLRLRFMNLREKKDLRENVNLRLRFMNLRLRFTN